MSSVEQPYFEIRASTTHGSGAFALRIIPGRTRLIEYTGERISHEEADSRPDVDDGTGSNHVLLFTVDKRTVIDARVGGNEAQYFNHSCDGNCEAVIEKRRVYLETIREVAAGEELTYDYEMEYSGEDIEAARRDYPCRCGSANCRGTLLDLPPKLLRQLRKAGEGSTPPEPVKPARAPEPQRASNGSKSPSRRTTAKTGSGTTGARGRRSAGR